MIYTCPKPFLPPFLLTLLQPSHNFFTELRTFMPLTCSPNLVCISTAPPLAIPFVRAACVVARREKTLVDGCGIDIRKWELDDLEKSPRAVQNKENP